MIRVAISMKKKHKKLKKPAKAKKYRKPKAKAALKHKKTKQVKAKPQAQTKLVEAVTSTAPAFDNAKALKNLYEKAAE